MSLLKILYTLLAIALIVGITACSVPGIKDSADWKLGVVTIAQMRQRACNNPAVKCQDWKKPDYYRENGNRVFREMANTRCWYHWEVDSKDRIVGWRVESESGDWWARNFCDFLPPPGEKFSPWS